MKHKIYFRTFIILGSIVLLGTSIALFSPLKMNPKNTADLATKAEAFWCMCSSGESVACPSSGECPFCCGETSGTPENGECGAANNTCLVGTFQDTLDDATNYRWRCNGIDGGATALCVLPKSGVISGVCASAHYNCSVGTSSGGEDKGAYWSWGCAGSGGGTTTVCTENKPPQNGQCESYAYSCAVGNSIERVEGDTYFTWKCEGFYGGSSASCSAPILRWELDPEGYSRYDAIGCPHNTPICPLSGVICEVEGMLSGACQQEDLCGFWGSGPYTIPGEMVCGRAVPFSPIVHGAWSAWSSCNVSCGVGTQGRFCTNPSPENGGQECLKTDGTRGLSETRSCDTGVPCCAPGTGTSCSSSSNSCGMTNMGTIQCNGSCSATTPLESSCPIPLCGGAENTCLIGTPRNDADTTTTWNWSCLNGSHVTACPKPKPNPTAPVIAGPKECTVNQSCTYTFSPGADTVVGNQIQYEIDWDNNGTVDHYVPLRAASGLPAYARGNDWPTTGNKTFKARVATSPDGRTSTWTPYTITVVPAPTHAVCGGARDVCGIGNHDEVEDTNLLFQWTCLGLDGGDNVSCSFPKPNPTAPVIFGPTTCVRDDSCTYTFSPGSDLVVENDIQYEIDWDNNGSIDQWSLPRSSSGLPEFLQNNDWSSTGVMTFKARVATIPDGRTSPWTPYDVTVNPPYIVGQCGGTQGTCVKGDASPLDTYELEWRWSCYGSGGGATVPCSKERDVAKLSVNTTNLSFPSFALGDPAWEQTLTISNIGSSISNLSGNMTGVSAPWSIVSGGTFTNLKKNGPGHVVTIRFNPTEIRSYTLDPKAGISSNGGTQDIALGGSAIQKITLSGNDIDFGEVPQTRTAYKTFVVTNNSQQHPQVFPTLTFPAPFMCVDGCSAGTLAVGTSRTIRVSFSPTEKRAYVHSATLLGQPLQLHGIGIAPVFKIEER